MLKKLQGSSHTNQLAQLDLAHQLLQRHSRQNPPDVDSHRALTSMASYPAKEQKHETTES